ncbi:lipopolysaccharide biosynthesis protein [Arthrobacter sunyaminii]|uniref:Lipopolysaccharide biosynthesis protein n=1 Tax=Arthrobacter sunyaminii TaxID=2816859 RepID=A0A975XLP0_9MICC|nr:lipopolysaccharide biosynthesis protein [Arthrobacter sunyaminii]MBO0908156.1 lipopolysaccharide biosynthesis protein [Arthrobacter sunyaminii]QWQ37164.1 lipopolysaccharide biosynthesis protein [Arthrobacter sunyaminii]
MTVDTANLGNHASRGAVQTVVWQAVRVGSQVIGLVALARLLSPSDFGLVAMTTAVVGIGEIIRDAGLSIAAIQAKHLSKGQKNNLFWVNTGIGLLFAVIVYASSGAIAAFYGDARIEPIGQLLSVTFLLNGMATQFRSELNRQMRFFALNAADTLPQVMALAAALVYASLTGSYYALVAQQLMAAFAGLVLVVAIARWTPGLPSRREPMRGFFRYGGGVAGSHMVSYLTKNVDTVAIGYVWGAASLGLYSRAYQLLLLPLNQLLFPMTRVALPVLSRLQDEPERFTSFLRKGQRIGGVIAAVTYGLLVGIADPLIGLFFGEQWLPLVPIFQVLALGGLFRALAQVQFWAYLALGLTGHQLRYSLVSQPLIAACMMLGVIWGPIGVAVAHSAAFACNWLVGLWWCQRVSGLNLRSLMTDGLRSFFLMFLPIAVLGACSVILVSHWLLAIIAAVAVPGCYIAVLLYCVPASRLDVVMVAEVVRQGMKRRSAS